MTTQYHTLVEYLAGRRTNIEYRRMLGFLYCGGGFAVRESPEPDSVDIVDYYSAKRHRKIPGDSQRPETVTRVFRDRIEMYPNRYPYGGGFQLPRLLAWLTSNHWTVRKNRSVKTDATHIVGPEWFFDRAADVKGWDRKAPALNLTLPAKDLAYTRYDEHIRIMREFRAKVREASTPVKDSFTLFPESGLVISHELVRHRQWIKEGRKEYMARRRELTNQFDVRAKLGAFDRLVEDVVERAASDEVAEAILHARDLAQLDPGNHSDLEKLAVASWTSNGYTAYRRFRRGVSGETLIPARKQFLQRHVEDMRRKLGAVVYS